MVLAELQRKLSEIGGGLLRETEIKIPAMEFVVSKIVGRFVDPKWAWIGLGLANIFDVVRFAPDTAMYVAIKLAEIVRGEAPKIEDLTAALENFIRSLGY